VREASRGISNCQLPIADCRLPIEKEEMGNRKSEIGNRKWQMTFLGVGPRFTILSVVFAAPLFVLHYAWHPFFVIAAVPSWVCYAVGAALLAAGVPFYVLALVTVRRGFKAGVLVTDGVYALCRHPIYGAWIVFIVPGVVAFSRSWLLFAIPVIVYVAFRLLIRREERGLEATFGQDYEDYKARVSCLFPRLRRRERP
jgi:protein-S-isoprenylcysteine O-methyltransferase Ste14